MRLKGFMKNKNTPAVVRRVRIIDLKGLVYEAAGQKIYDSCDPFGKDRLSSSFCSAPVVLQ